MHIDFQPPFVWQELNDKAEAALGIAPNGGSLKIVAGPRQALKEVTLGIVRQFPHKKKIYFFRGIDPMLETAVAGLAAEGCTVQGLDAKLMSRPDELNQAIDADALLVLVSEDDPLLGRLNELEALERLSETAKFFLIRVSHFHHRYLPLTTQFPRHLIRVNSLGPRLAVILTSARVRWPIQFVESTGLPIDALPSVLTLKNQELVNPMAIERFEDLATTFGAFPAFPAGTHRVPDRAIIYWKDMDGLAVMERLADRMGLLIPAAGEPTPIETTSLNRWRATKAMAWLVNYGFTDEMVRGSLILDHDLLSPELVEHLKVIRAEILAVQSAL